jgi:alanine dehydrogenase
MLVISRAEVEELLAPATLVEAVAGGFRALSAGEVEAPPRQAVEVERGALLTRSGRRAGGPVVVKLVGVFPRNADTHPSMICLLDAGTGRALALMDGAHVTAMRTAAGSTLSIRLAARDGARVLSVIGSGVQARAHLRLLAPQFEEIRVCARNAAAARALADDFGARVTDAPADGADVICLATGAPEPVLRAGDVAPGTHVTSVGYAPPRGELDPELVRRARLLVETRGAFAPPPAGCGELAGMDPASATELGEILLGRAAGRTSPDEITVYKAMGHVAEDIVAAELVHRLAREAGAGIEIEL